MARERREAVAEVMLARKVRVPSAPHALAGMLTVTEVAPLVATVAEPMAVLAPSM